jgi:hypothetical protein
MTEQVQDQGALTRLAEARTTLERLWSLTHGEDPHEPVPARWVTAWHQAASAITSYDDQEWDGLDGPGGVNMRMLHHRACEALHDADQLVAGLAIWPAHQESHVAATHRSTP